MAGNQTLYSAQEVENTAQEHDQLADLLESEMGILRTDIEHTLSQSSSAMTHALDSTYDEFSTEIKKHVVDNMHAMAGDMRSALSKQQQANLDAGQGVKAAQSEVRDFLKPAV